MLGANGERSWCRVRHVVPVRQITRAGRSGLKGDPVKLTGNTRRHRWVAVLTTSAVLATAGTAVADQVLGDSDIVEANVQNSPQVVTLAPGASTTVEVGGQIKSTGSTHVSFPVTLAVTLGNPSGHTSMLSDPSPTSGDVTAYGQNLVAEVLVTAPAAGDLVCGETNTFNGSVIFTAMTDASAFSGSNNTGSAPIQLKVEGPACDDPGNSAPEVTLTLDRNVEDSACTVDASAAWTDADEGDTHSVTFDWGDSTDDTVVDPATSPTDRSHTYDSAGTYTVIATVSDGTDSGFDQGDFTAYNTPSAVLQPINLDASSVFKIKSTIPVKITVTGCDGEDVDDLAPTITLRKFTGDVLGDDLEAVTSTSAADSGNTMRWSADGLQYIYNMATKNRTAGTYQVSVSDGSFAEDVVATFGLR